MPSAIRSLSTAITNVLASCTVAGLPDVPFFTLTLPGLTLAPSTHGHPPADASVADSLGVDHADGLVGLAVVEPDRERRRVRDLGQAHGVDGQEAGLGHAGQVVLWREENEGRAGPLTAGPHLVGAEV